MTKIEDILKTMEYGPAPESSADVRLWLAAHEGGFGHFINGRFTAPSDKMIAVFDPATETQLASVPHGSQADVDAAMTAARKAFGKWSARPGHERAGFMYAIARQIQKRSRFLAVLETMDNGKTIRETRDIDIPLVARHFYHHAGWAEIMEEEFPGYSPTGVCGQVIPWNFPMLMLAWKIAPALAAGNTVVLKPADLTPLTAIAFAEICMEVGLPDGVVNIVHGAGDTGAAICGHPEADKIAFTGSTAVGRLIREQIAGSGKKLSLELGGKSPFIVFDDADLDGAVEGVVDAIWFNQGEVCCAGSRVLVQEGIAEAFFAKLKSRMETLRVGDPLDKTMDMGAIVSKGQLARINGLLAKGTDEGGTLHRAQVAIPEKGAFSAPGFFTGTEPASSVNREEIFGPVAVTGTFRTVDEAISLANNTAYGLAASVWSENINLAIEAAAKVKAGVVWINATNLFDAAAGFGGMRESGFGREGARAGMFEYLSADWEKSLPNAKPETPFVPSASPDIGKHELPGQVSRTAKFYIGGKQARPDGGNVYSVLGKGGAVIGEAGIGNRKDIRNAVEAASKASGWSGVTGHNRAQVLYFLAENLDTRRSEFEALLVASTGASAKAAAAEVEASVRRIFWYAAQADKYDGAVQSTMAAHITLAINEPFGVVGVVCPDEAPLLSFISLVMPVIAMGNSAVVVPSQRHPLLATTFYQVLETSDVPAGVVNIVTGAKDELSHTLASHDGVSLMWYLGSQEGAEAVEKAACGNLKPVWANYGRVRDWANPKQGQGRDYLRRATQVKTVWLPYGE